MTTTLRIAASALVLAIATPAMAQTQKPAAPEMASPPQKMTDGSFVQMAMISNGFELKSSQMAAEKGQSAEVKVFAEQMIADHTKAGDALKSALAEANITVPPAAPLDAKHQKMLDELTTASGEDFDKAYVKMQTQAHIEAVTLFRAYSNAGDNAQLKAFAAETLPTLEKHLDHAKKLTSSM
jgi:putative membrane protein